MAKKKTWLWLLVGFAVIVLGFSTLILVLNRLLVGATPRLSDRTIVEVSIAGQIVERPATFWGETPIGPLSVREIDQTLRAAASDPRISAVVLKVGPVLTGFAKAQEIRAAVHAVRDAGKPVTAYVELGTIMDLYVASAADHIVQVPTGMFILGLLSTTQYYGDLLGQLGVEFEVFHTGPYKTAMNSYVADDMTEEEREVIDSLLGDLWQQILSDIANDRDMAIEDVEAALDLGLLTAEQSRDAGLVDDLGFDDRSLPGRASRLGLRDYWRAAGTNGSWLAPTIALVHVDGMIVPGNIGGDLFGGGLAGGDAIANEIRAARTDPQVAAIVLRVDSPGGAVSASDVILREAELAAESKPLIVSMSDVAASGGYWIATSASRILAGRGTYTGSIGVISSRINFAGAYEKLGIGTAAVKRGANADLFLDSAPLRPEQQAILQASVDYHYQTFLEKVATARGMSIADVERLAAGRVWSGAQALEVGLIDQIGGLHDALEVAAEQSGSGPGYRVRVYPRARSVFEQLGDVFATARSSSLLGAWSDATAEDVVTRSLLRSRIGLLQRLGRAGSSWALSQSPVPVPAR